MDYGRFLVISIGTGSAKIEEQYNATMAAKWGILDWLTNGGWVPLVDVFTQACADMVDFHIALLFQARKENYLRIQVRNYDIFLYVFKLSNAIKHFSISKIA